MADAQRSVSARWDGGWRAVVTAGEFELRVDEPVTVDGGTGTGPQPTELLLGAVASCFTLAVAHVARKRGRELLRSPAEVERWFATLPRVRPGSAAAGA